jgi:FdhE protein
LVTRDTTRKILEVLQKQEKEEGKLPLLLEFYRDLLRTQAKARSSLGTLEPNIDAEAVQGRLAVGQPLIVFNELSLDWPLLRRVFLEVIDVFAKYPALFGEIPSGLKGPDTGNLLTEEAVRAWFNGDELPAAILEGVNEGLIRTIVQSTLQPFLAGHAEALAGLVTTGNWQKNFCPVCGGIPDIAYFEKEVGARLLLCSRCDSEWQFHRIECPFCRTQDQHALSFLADDANLYRLYLCEKCKRYLKVIDLRKTDVEVLMPLERILTLDLDRQARERGYHSHEVKNR